MSKDDPNSLAAYILSKTNDGQALVDRLLAISAREESDTRTPRIRTKDRITATAVLLAYCHPGSDEDRAAALARMKGAL